MKINNEVPVPPHNTGITGGMTIDLPPRDATATVSTPRAGIRMPTEDELKTIYGDIANHALQNHSAKALKQAPKDWEAASSYDVTPKHLMGVGRTVFDIKGVLYLRTEVIVPDAKPKWFKLGPAPMF